jgi:hypothetical protein
VKHVLLSRIFGDPDTLNPTVTEFLCHLVHWSVTLMYNVLDVADFSIAASRAGQMAVINIVLLAISHHLAFVSYAFGFSLHTLTKIHQSLAVMGTIQGILHSLMQYAVARGRSSPELLLQIVVLVLLESIISIL